MKSEALINKYGWTEWLCKTNFSFLVGASHPSEIIETACKHQYAGLAVNDFDGVYGLARSFISNQKQERPVKLFMGAELQLSYTPELSPLLWDSVVAIAKNKKGYQSLNQIISFSHRDSKKEVKLNLRDLHDFNLDDLIFIQPMRGRLRSQFFEETYKNRKALFKNYSLALSRHLHPVEDQYIKKQIDLAKNLKLPLVFSQDAFFHCPHQKPTSDLLNSIRSNRVFKDSQDLFFPNAERHLHSLEDLENIYSPLPDYEQALIHSNQLAKSIDFHFSELKYQYPSEMIPEGYHAQSYLEALTWEGAKKRFGERLSAKIQQTLHHELALIKDLGFADYFLTVWDIVRFARSQNILCQGRGSAANSAVCYVLEVTAVNPMHFDLLFERFMSKERGDPPDIDVDFEHERREEVIQYIYKRYGRKRAAMVANVITFKKKGAMRAVGKAIGFHEDLLSKASNLQRTLLFRRKKPSDVIDDITKQEDAAPSYGPNQYALWQKLSERLIGFPRHLGIHSGGFIIAGHELNELVAQEPASMEGRSVIQWCKEDIEALGFFKIDVLALGMLSALRKCFDQLEKHYDYPLDLYNIPNEDEATYSMIQKADTVGVFQIESRAQMSMLPRLRPKCFYDLVIEIAIIRPGPIQGGIIHPYLKRRQGLEPVVFPSEKLRPILSKTLGVAIFQEQAMRIAIEVGDFTPGEANELRKNIGAWNLPGYQQNLGPMLEKLERGMRKNKIKEEFIKILLQQMKGFAEYGFPESHSISFAFLAYASSYLKCHYPAVFFTAILNSQPMGFYSPHALLQAAKRDGVSLLGIDLQSSDWEHKLEAIAFKEPPLYGIRMGFCLIKGLSKAAALRIMEQRQKNGSFKSFPDFLSRCLLYRDELTALAASNCFSIFGLERKEALWLAEALPIKPMIEQSEKSLHWKKEAPFERIEKDFKSFQTSLAEHPASLVKHSYWPYRFSKEDLISSNDFSKLLKNQVVKLFGMILVRQAPPSAKGMMFITLEDEYGFINLVVSPQVYELYHNLIESYAFVCVEAKMQKEGEGYSFWVKRFYPPENNLNVKDLRKKRTEKKESRLTNQVEPKKMNLHETKRWIEAHREDFKQLRELNKSRNYH